MPSARRLRADGGPGTGRAGEHGHGFEDGFDLCLTESNNTFGCGSQMRPLPQAAVDRRGRDAEHVRKLFDGHEPFVKDAFLCGISHASSLPTLSGTNWCSGVPGWTIRASYG